MRGLEPIRNMLSRHSASHALRRRRAHKMMQKRTDCREGMSGGLKLLILFTRLAPSTPFDSPSLPPKLPLATGHRNTIRQPTTRCREFIARPCFVEGQLADRWVVA